MKMSYRDQLYREYVRLFDAFKELHATRGVSQELINELYEVDVAVDSIDFDALDKVRNLYGRAVEELKHPQNWLDNE